MLSYILWCVFLGFLGYCFIPPIFDLLFDNIIEPFFRYLWKVLSWLGNLLLKVLKLKWYYLVLIFIIVFLVSWFLDLSFCLDVCFVILFYLGVCVFPYYLVEKIKCLFIKKKQTINPRNPKPRLKN